MCGISAIINSSSKPVAIELLRRMNAQIRHRGPDGEGFFIDGPVGLGHQMLKIMDLGPANAQPMRFKEYVISYNGEIYNFREIRKELRQLGYEFQTETDTEVLLAAYDAWKEDCVHHLNGMWAFVLYDEKKKSIFASRDRFGIKPLCYMQLHEKFLIGSEIKQFTAFNEFNAKLNQRTAFDFLYNGKLNVNEDSMFENVRFLPAGSNLSYSLATHTYKINKWYELNPTSKKPNISLPDALDEFRRLFSESVLNHLYAHVPLGSCLSGGADSTSMLAVANNAGVRLTTYSSCFLSKECNEIDYINAAVDFYQVPNYKIYPDVHELITQGELEKLVYQQDQPITCGSFYSEYKVYSLAARHKTRVILGGGGADEYLGGYGEFYHVFLKSLFRRGKIFAYTSEFLQLPQVKIRLVEMLRPFLRVFGKRYDGIQDNGFKNSFNKEWFNENFVEQDSPQDLKNVDQLSNSALLNYSLPHQLHSEDRSSMSFSLESRLPFLDHRLVEFCLSLPDEFKLRNGTTKYILRESMRSILPNVVYKRSKFGLPGPEEPLFKSHLPTITENFEEMVGNYPEIFSDQVLTLLRNYGEKKIPYHNFLFRLLSFGAWAKSFNVSSSGLSSTRISNYGKASERIKIATTS